MASLYIASYALGFGSYIGSFVTIDMIFSTSIRDLVTIYFTGILIPIILGLSRYSTGNPNKHALILRIEDNERRERELEAWHSRRRIAMLVFWFISIAITVYAIFLNYYQAQRFSVFAVGLAWQPLFAMYVMQFASKVTDDNFTYELIFIGSLLIFSALITGFDRGAVDRNRTFAQTASYYPSCQNKAVLRAFGDLYLAVDSADRKVLIDVDCKVRFIIPKA